MLKNWWISDILLCFQLQESKPLGSSTEIFESTVLSFHVPKNNHFCYWRSGGGGQVFLFYFFMVTSEDLFPLPALTHCGLFTVRSPQKRRIAPPRPLWARSTQCHTWCKVNLEDSLNLLFICKWRELSSGFFLGNAFRHPRLEPIPASPGNMSFQ